MTEDRLTCACGCGREFRPRRAGQRFSGPGCRNRFNSRARREREKLGLFGVAAGPAGPGAPGGGNGTCYISLAALAAGLITLTPEQEEAVRELVRLERARRAADLEAAGRVASN